MSVIGAYTFLKLNGTVNPGGGEQLEDITRPGVNGVAFRKTGKRGAPFKMQSIVDVATEADAKALVLNYKALQGSVVSITDSTGAVWDDYIVLKSVPVEIQPIKTAIGGLTSSPDFLVKCDWTLQATTT